VNWKLELSFLFVTLNLKLDFSSYKLSISNNEDIINESIAGMFSIIEKLISSTLL